MEQGPQAKAWLSAKYCIYPQVTPLALNYGVRQGHMGELNHISDFAITTDLHCYGKNWKCILSPKILITLEKIKQNTSV